MYQKGVCGVMYLIQNFGITNWISMMVNKLGAIRFSHTMPTQSAHLTKNTLQILQVILNKTMSLKMGEINTRNR